jgi:hypothetical protein
MILPPALAILAGWLTAWRRREVTRIAVTGIAGLLALSLQVALTAPKAARPIGSARWGGGMATLAVWLEGHDDRVVWANYWTSYAVAAQSGGAIIAAPTAPARFPPWTRLAEQVPDTVLVVAAGEADDRALQRRTDLPPSTRTVVAGRFAVWVFDGHVARADLPIGPF